MDGVQLKHSTRSTSTITTCRGRSTRCCRNPFPLPPSFLSLSFLLLFSSPFPLSFFLSSTTNVHYRPSGPRLDSNGPEMQYSPSTDLRDETMRVTLSGSEGKEVGRDGWELRCVSPLRPKSSWLTVVASSSTKVDFAGRFSPFSLRGRPGSAPSPPPPLLSLPLFKVHPAPFTAPPPAA